MEDSQTALHRILKSYPKSAKFKDDSVLCHENLTDLRYYKFKIKANYIIIIIRRLFVCRSEARMQINTQDSRWDSKSLLKNRVVVHRRSQKSQTDKQIQARSRQKSKKQKTSHKAWTVERCWNMMNTGWWTKTIWPGNMRSIFNTYQEKRSRYTNPSCPSLVTCEFYMWF